jgi:hypothetical protein
MSACGLRRRERFIECRTCAGTLDVVVPGWRDVQHGCGMEVWENVDGNYLGLVRTLSNLGLPDLRDETDVRGHCRTLAGRMEAELVEAEMLDHLEGRAVAFISKRAEGAAVRFTGVLIVPTPRATWVWTTCAEERRVGGVREPDQPLATVRRELRNLCAVRLDADRVGRGG